MESVLVSRNAVSQNFVVAYGVFHFSTAAAAVSFYDVDIAAFNLLNNKQYQYDLQVRPADLRSHLDYPSRRK